MDRRHIGIIVLATVHAISCAALFAKQEVTGPWSYVDEVTNRPFEVDDVVVSDPDGSIIDPEFDKSDPSSPRMVWQDLEGDLWVADVDPITGTWWPLDGRQFFVDSGLANIFETRQGPEWAYDDQGNRVVYTKFVRGRVRLYQASLDPASGAYLPDRLKRGINREVRRGSTNVGDTQPVVLYLTKRRNVDRIGWRALDDPSTDTLLPKGVRQPRWVSGSRGLIATFRGKRTTQIFYHAINSGRSTQLTFDATEKRHPTMWYDPATGYQLLAATMDERNIGIWRQDASKNWILEGSFRPQTDLPYLTRPDWFIWDGASYLSYMAHTEKSAQEQNVRGTGEAWVTRVSGAGPFQHRRVSSPTVTRMKDVENLPLLSTVYIYYEEILDGDNGRRLVHRAATGLE